MGGAFSEVAACGTAVVVTPVSSITYQGKTVTIGSDADTVGATTRKLYNRVRAIQTGDAEDKFGWMVDL